MLYIKRRWSFLLIITCLSFLAGCYGGDSERDLGETSTTDKEKVSDNMLHLAAAGELPTLKTNGQLDGLSQTVMINVFEGLYRLDQDNNITEGVAESFDLSGDDKTYTFHLRKDANWSNGESITAHDFIYAWKKALHPDTFSPHAYLMGPIKNAEQIQDPDSDLYGKVDKLGVKATDDFTLEVTLENSVPYFQELLTNPVFFPQNEEFAQSQGNNYGLEPENLIYNGPFVMNSWDHDQGWVLKKNKEYWDSDTVKLDTIDYKVAKDTSTEVNLYESGALDIANLSSEFVDIYSEDDEYRTSINAEIYFIRLNQKNKYLSNANIRKAIDMAYDKKQATDVILKNGSLPAYFLIPKDFVLSPQGDDFREKYGDMNKGSIEEAQKLWKQGLAELNESEISLEFLSYDDGQRKSVAEYIKNQLEKNLSGLTISINQQPNKQKLALEDKQDYDMSYSGWRNDISDPIDYLSIFLSDGPYNWQSFDNKNYDQLVKKAQKDFTDIDQRFTDLQDAEQILIDEEAAISPLYQSGSARLIKPYVKGFVAHPENTFSYKWVSIE